MSTRQNELAILIPDKMYYIRFLHQHIVKDTPVIWKHLRWASQYNELLLKSMPQALEHDAKLLIASPRIRGDTSLR